jgi:phosphatidylglycerol---prolipoprotein diacylglyceryl transferase
MHPKLFSFDVPEFLQGILPAHISVHSYGFMIALGVLVSFYVALKMTKRYGLDSDKLSSMFLWVMLASVVGGRIFFYFEDIDKYINNPSELLKMSGGGFVFYGSLIFAIPTIIWWLRKRKIPVRPMLDVIAFISPIIQSFGRVGCFLAGCCHGKVCDNALGVSFTHPDTMARPMDTPLYPTQLFDIGINIIIIITLLFLKKKKKFEGQLFLIYIVMYGVGRSINEIYRGDEARGFVFNGLLSHSQFIAICLIAISTYFWFRWNKTKVSSPEESLED